MKYQELKCGAVPAYTVSQPFAGGTQHVKFSLTEFEQPVVVAQAHEESDTEPKVKRARELSCDYYREDNQGDPYS